VKGCRILATLIGGALLFAGPARAHPLAPSLLEVHAADGGRAHVRWKTPAARPRGEQLSPVLPDGCEREGPETIGLEGTGRVVEFDVRCPFESWTGRTLGVDGLASRGTGTVLRFVDRDGRSMQLLLTADAPRLAIPARPDTRAIAERYVELGIEHLMLGFDHVLFVMGLLLLVRGRRQLLLTISAFTLGHSITLAAAVLGFVHVPTAPVEVAIALSILAPAVEVVRGPAARPSWLRRAPWAAALAFGMLHGLGFAGALAALGLPAGSIPLALLSFNVGIELGQLAWVVLAGGMLLAWRTVSGRGLSPAFRQALGYPLGMAAGAWFWIRLFAWLGDPLA